MTLQELFMFDENDLRFNRSGRLSPAQQTRWQQSLSRNRRWQRGCTLVGALVIGGVILVETKYFKVFLLDIPPDMFPWITSIGLLMVAFPILLAIKARWSANKKMQRTEAEVDRGQVTPLEGPLQISHVFYPGDMDGAGVGYITTLSLGGQKVLGSNPKITGEEWGMALYEVFGLPQPPEQSTAEKRKRIPQVTEIPGTYRVYCLHDDWGQYHVLSLELVRQ